MNESLHGSPSHVRAAIRLLGSALRKGRGAGPDIDYPKRKLAVEWRGAPPRTERLAAYLAATGGEGMPHDPASDAPLPPLYPVLWETALFLELLARAPGAPPFGGLIHLASERLQLRPLRARDSVRCRIELDRAEPRAGGVQLTLVSRTWSESGQLCSQGEMLVLLRERGTRHARSGQRKSRNKRSAPAANSDPSAGSRELANWALGANHGRRYARASGDYNPIHLWPWTARPFGFRRPILHGHCTEALVAHALIRTLWENDPTALRRLQIRFRAPLPLPNCVRLLVGEESAGRGVFWVVGEGGKKGWKGDGVYAEGSFTGG